MDQSTAVLFSAGISAFAGVVGAAAGIGGGLLLERYRRNCASKAMALAVAGSVETALWAIERRGHIAHFKACLDRMRAGEDINFYSLIKEDQARDFIMDGYLEHLGVLGGEFLSLVIRFVQTMWAIKVDAARVGPESSRN